MSAPNGGHAYPGVDLISAGLGNGHIRSPYHGMTLRDAFAMRAPPMPDWFQYAAPEPREVAITRQIAEWAYVYADAMIAERAK